MTTSALTTNKQKSRKAVAKNEPNEVDVNMSDKENADSYDGIKWVYPFYFSILLWLCSWLINPANTSWLLVIIEESIHFCKAFRFQGGDVPGVTSGGYTTAQTSHKIGESFFLICHCLLKSLGKWSLITSGCRCSIFIALSVYLTFIQAEEKVCYIS